MELEVAVPIDDLEALETEDEDEADLGDGAKTQLCAGATGTGVHP